MTKLGEIIHYASYLTLILILFSVLSPVVLAGNGVGAGNNDKNEKTSEAPQKKDMVREETRARNQSENKTLERSHIREEAQERTQLKEQLKIHNSNYQTAKKNFIAVRKQLRSGDYDDGDLEITREYLNASIDYMIAHLERVQYNLEQSNGNGTETRVAAIEERISELEKEKNAIGKAEDLEDFKNATKSVRGVWNNVRNRTSVETGQTASEKIDFFVNKSEGISNKIDKEIKNLNKTGVNTTGLEVKLANYNSLMDSARENNEAAKKIYNNVNATEEELQKADGYLQNALKEIKEANQVLKEIFGELEQYRTEETNRNRTQNSLGTEFNNSGTVNNTVNSSSASYTSLNGTKTSPEGENNNSTGNESENSNEDGLES